MLEPKGLLKLTNDEISKIDDFKKLERYGAIAIGGTVVDPENEKRYIEIFKVIQSKMIYLSLFGGHYSSVMLIDIDKELDKIKTISIMAMIKTEEHFNKEKKMEIPICLN